MTTRDPLKPLAISKTETRPSGPKILSRDVAIEPRSAYGAEKSLLNTSEFGSPELLYQSLVENSADCIWQTGPGSDPRTLYMNPAALSVFEIDTLEEAIRIPGKTFFSEEANAFMRAHREARQHGRREASYEVDLISAKQTHKRVLLRPVDIYGPDQRWLSTLVTFRDLTPQHALVQKLKESEHRFQALVENGVTGILQVSQPLNPRTSYMNPAMIKMLEIESLEAALEIAPKRYFSDEMWAIVSEQRALRQRGEGSSFYEIELTTMHGNRKWAILSPADIYDASGAWESTLLTVLDITEQHNLQSELREREHLYKTLTDNTITPIWHTKPDGTTIYMNQAAADLLELQSVEDGMSLTVSDTLSPEADQIRNEQTKDRSKGKGSHYELEIQTRKGNLRYVHVSAAPLISERGEWLSSIATFTDLTEKKEKEREQEKNVAMFKALIANMPEGVFVEDVNHRLVAINDLMLQVFSLKDGPERIDEVIGASSIGGEMLVAHLTIDPENYKRFIREARKSEKPILSYEILFRDGRSFETDYVPISTRTGERIGQLWTYRDTTEKKVIERRLRESESQYRLLFEENPHPMWVIDWNTLRFLEVNQAAIRTYGYSHEEFMKMRVSDIRSDSESIQFDDLLTRVQDAIPNHRLEITHQTKEGKDLIVDLVSNQIEFQGKLARYALAQDITARRNTENELYRSRLNLNALVENTTDMISSYDREMRLVTWNSAFENLFKNVLHVEIYEGMGLRERVPPNEAELWEQWMRRGLNGEQFVEERVYHAGDVSTTMEASCFPIYEHGLVTGVMFFNRDITKRKQMEHELVEAKEHAEEMNRLKSSFLANMSHEIRTPMTAIQGFASLISETTNEPDTLEYSERVLAGGKRLLNTINDILDIARIEANRIELNLQVIDLAKEIEQTTALLLPLVEDKNLRLNIRVLSKGVQSNLDPHYFGQIITNLVSNAVKFTGRGDITIEIDRDESENPHALIRVSDTGIGIRPDFIPHLFEEFRQESQGFGRKFEGSGLGLSIVKRLTEMMHGDISVQSLPDHGSVFTLRFPLHHGHGQEFLTPEGNVGVDLGTPMPVAEKLLLLLVEDNPENAELTRLFLQGIYHVDLAESGEQALRMTAAKKYDIILMDVGLGHGLSGLEVTRTLRKHREYKETPIIALTGYAMVSDREGAFAAGCNAFVTKPYLRSDLIKAINESSKIAQITRTPQ